jgi:hypothetical protein
MKRNDVSNNKNKGPVPYTSLSPGFEAVYTGKESLSGSEKVEIITTLTSDNAGHEIRKWSVVSWTWPGREKDWDEEIKYINDMQGKLGDLNDDTRQIRAHIASLVPCDSGFPVTVDELLNAIGKGKLDEPSFHNGCWCSGMWWQQKTTQPFQNECMKTIHTVLKDYLAGKIRESLFKEFPYAAKFINRTYDWLGPVSKLKDYQKLMIERILLTIDSFTTSNHIESPFSDASTLQKQELLVKELFEEGGQGACRDMEISEKTGLPKIYPRWKPEYQETLDRLEDIEKRELYQTCCAIASGVYTLSDCHHNTFRYIESWIHGIGTGRLNIQTRKSGTEEKRLGRLLFGYVLGLDKWLVGIPMPFLLLELGHIDFGFDPKNEILRVYAYLGEERTAAKEWLAACLWHNLFNSPIGGNPGGLVRHRNLLERAAKAGVSLREWMDSVLMKGALCSKT